MADEPAREPQAVPGALSPETISGDDLLFIQVARRAQMQAAAQLAGAFQARDAANAQWDMASGIVAQKHRMGPYDSIDDQNGVITRVAQQGSGPVSLLAVAGDQPVASESSADTGSDADVGEQLPA